MTAILGPAERGVNLYGPAASTLWCLGALFCVAAKGVKSWAPKWLLCGTVQIAFWAARAFYSDLVYFSLLEKSDGVFVVFKGCVNAIAPWFGERIFEDQSLRSMELEHALKKSG